MYTTGKCTDYTCTNRTEEGFCKTTGCIKHPTYLYSTYNKNNNLSPNQTLVDLNNLKGGENWKINIGDKVLDIRISKQEQKPNDAQSIIEWRTDKPKYDDDFLVCVRDDTGDTPYTYVTCATYLSVDDIWISLDLDEILSGVYAWGCLPKPIKYKG